MWRWRWGGGRRIGLAAGADGGRHRHRHGGGRVQRLLRRRAAAAAHRGDAVHHVHPAGRDAADHGQARRRGGAGAGRVLHGRRRAGPRAHAAGAAGDAGTGLGLVQRTRAGWPCSPSAATPNRRGPQDCGSTRRASWPMSWPAGCTGWPACSSARRPARAIRWWAIRCCCRCSRPWWWAARGWAAAGAGPWARCSAPTS